MTTQVNFRHEDVAVLARNSFRPIRTRHRGYKNQLQFVKLVQRTHNQINAEVSVVTYLYWEHAYRFHLSCQCVSLDCRDTDQWNRGLLLKSRQKRYIIAQECPTLPRSDLQRKSRT